MKKLSLSKLAIVLVTFIVVIFLLNTGKKWFNEGVNDAKANKEINK